VGVSHSVSLSIRNCWAQAWIVRGAIVEPYSVSTRQVGAAPNRYLWSAMHTAWVWSAT